MNVLEFMYAVLLFDGSIARATLHSDRASFLKDKTFVKGPSLNFVTFLGESAVKGSVTPFCSHVFKDRSTSRKRYKEAGRGDQ